MSPAFFSSARRGTFPVPLLILELGGDLLMMVVMMMMMLLAVERK